MANYYNEGMRRQRGFTIHEMVLTITVFIVVTAAITAYVGGSFDTTRTRAQTLLQQVKTIETAFATYVAINNYNSKIFPNESAQLTLNAMGMQQAGYLKGFIVKDLTRTTSQWNAVSYVDFAAVEKDLIGSVFATRLLTGQSTVSETANSSRANYRNFFIILDPSEKLALTFYNLCNGTTITALPEPFPPPQELFAITPEKKCKLLKTQEYWGEDFDDIGKMSRGKTLGNYSFGTENITHYPGFLKYHLGDNKPSALIVSYEFL